MVEAANLTVTKHDEHPLTGATYSVFSPPSGNRSWPLAISFTQDELAELVLQASLLLGKFPGKREE